MSELEYLKSNFPNLIKLFDNEELDEIRYFVVVDPNIEEEADEADVFDPTEYNWMIFFPERVKEYIGDEIFSTLGRELQSLEIFKDILDDDEDLYGVLCEESEERIIEEVLKVLDRLAKRRLEEIDENA